MVLNSTIARDCKVRPILLNTDDLTFVEVLDHTNGFTFKLNI